MQNTYTQYPEDGLYYLIMWNSEHGEYKAIRSYQNGMPFILWGQLDEDRREAVRTTAMKKVTKKPNN